MPPKSIEIVRLNKTQTQTSRHTLFYWWGLSITPIATDNTIENGITITPSTPFVSLVAPSSFTSNDVAHKDRVDCRWMAIENTFVPKSKCTHSTPPLDCKLHTIYLSGGYSHPFLHNSHCVKQLRSQCFSSRPSRSRPSIIRPHISCSCCP